MREDLLASSDYAILGEFRCDLRRFLGPAETSARRLGIPPQQHQALLVIAGRHGADGVGIGDLAGCLNLRVHTITELVDRMVASELLSRSGHAQDRRRTVLALTERARDLLRRLAGPHSEELRAIEPLVRKALERLNAHGHSHIIL